MTPEILLPGPDEQFFKQHKKRQCRLRDPLPGDDLRQFEVLGDHDVSRRKILVWRVPENNPYRQLTKFLKIPFLQFADESIEDDDKHLLPLLKEIMENAAKDHKMRDDDA